MLDKIMEMVGTDAINTIAGKTGISMDQAVQMLPLAKESLTEGLMTEVTKGNTDGLLGLFNSVGSNGLADNSIFGSLKGLFIKKIISNLNLPESIASLAAGSGLTSILGGMAGMMRQDGDNEGIDINNIMNVLGAGGGAAGLLGNLMGGASDNTGGLVDSLKDAAGDILGGTSETKNQSGNLFSSLKNAAGAFFK